MTEKPFTIESERIGSTYSIHIFKGDEVIFEISNWESLSNMHKKECEEFVDYLNSITDENEQLKEALIELKEIGDYHYTRIEELSDENKQLKKGMIEVVDRYIKNVECNPPSSLRTYGKIKGALINIREGLRDLIEELE